MARNTLTKKAAAARKRSAGALHLFRSAAAELEQAAQAHNEVANWAGAEETKHALLKAEHVTQATEAANAATKLRDLVGEGA